MKKIVTFLLINGIWRQQARDKLEKSMVADNDSGKSVMSEVRTSSGMFIEKHQVTLFLRY